MVMISERAAEAEDQAVPGHGEGELIIVKDCKFAIETWRNELPDTPCCCICRKTVGAEGAEADRDAAWRAAAGLNLGRL